MNLISQAAERSLRDMACASFRVGDEPIEVLPRFALPNPLNLMTATVGPFYPDVPVMVPLWIAVLLRKRNLVRLVAPAWMSVEHLKLILKDERRDTSSLSLSSQLPMHYLEFAHALLNVSGGYSNSGGGDGLSSNPLSTLCDIERAPEVIMLLQDIESIRLDKLRSKLHHLSQNELSNAFSVEEGPAPGLMMDASNIGTLELLHLAPFVKEALRVQNELSGAPKTDANLVVEQDMALDEEKSDLPEPQDERSPENIEHGSAATRTTLRRFR